MMMPNLTQREMAAAMRLLDHEIETNFSAFIRKSFATVSPGDAFSPNWHIKAIAYALDRVSNGEVKRLLILMPPRHLKSICASIAFPAWLLGHDPTLRIICVQLRGGFGCQACQRLPRRHAVALVQPDLSGDADRSQKEQ